MSDKRILPQILSMLTRLQQYKGRDAIDNLRVKIDDMVSNAGIVLPAEYDHFLSAYQAYRTYNIEDAIPGFLHSKMLSKKQDNCVLHLYCELHLGTIYSLLGYSHQALKHFLKAYENTSIKDDNFHLLLNLNIGDAYLLLSDFTRAEQHCRKAEKIANAIQDKTCLALSQMNIALALAHRGKLDRAFKWINKSINIAKETDCPRSMGFAWSYWAQILTFSHQFDLAEQKYKQACEYFKESYEFFGHSENLYHYAKLLLADGRTEQALIKCSEAKALLSQDNNYNARSKLHELEAEIYREQGKLQQERDVIALQVKEANTELQRAAIKETHYIENILKLGAEKRDHDMLHMLHNNLKIITQIGQQIATARKIENCLNDIYTQLNTIIPIDVFGIAFHDKQKNQLNYDYFIEKHQILPKFVIGCNNMSSIGSYCIKHGETIHLNTNTAKDISVYVNPEEMDSQMYFGEGDTCQSAIITPIILNGVITGVLFLEHHTPYAYQHYHCELAQQLASFIAVSLENQRQTLTLKRQQLELKTINKKLDTISRQDPLTGLWNRYELEAVVPYLINQATNKKQPLSCLMIDIDYYKDFNDHFGHHKGDEVLKILAAFFRSIFNSDDDYVFRYGGDEFLILLYNQPQEEAYAKATKLQIKLSDALIMHPKSCCSDRLSLTIGAYCWQPQDNVENSENMTINTLIQLTDQALYFGKNQQRNSIATYDNILKNENLALNILALQIGI